MLAMLAALDDSVDKIVAALKQARLYSNTVIIFSSDNGGAVADMQQGAMNNFPLRGQKKKQKQKKPSTSGLDKLEDIEKWFFVPNTGGMEYPATIWEGGSTPPVSS